MSRQQRRSFLVFLGVVVATLALAAQVRAGDQGHCDSPGTFGVTLRVWENAIGDTSDGNDTAYLFCNQGTGPGYSYNDLTLIAHTPAGLCHGQFAGQDTWNDCISSATVWMPSSLWRVCFYKLRAHKTLMYYLSGHLAGSRYDISLNDATSSLKITNDGTC